MSVSLLMPQSLWFLPTHQLLLCNAVLRDKTVYKPSCFSMWKTSIFSFVLVYFQRGLRKTSLLFILALKNISRLCVHICVCIGARAGTHVFACTWKPEVRLRCPSSGAVHLGFGTGSLTGLEAVKVRLTACGPRKLASTSQLKVKASICHQDHLFLSFKIIVGFEE